MRRSPMTNHKHFRSPTLTYAFLLAAAMVVLSLSSVALAQETTGSIRGVVVDPNGLAVTNATVTAKDQATGTTTTAATGSEGGFVISKLLPGKYTVTVEAASGFKKRSVTDVDVRLGQNSLANLALEI